MAERSSAGAILVLPGGKASSAQPTRPWQLAHVRMAWLTAALRRRAPAHVEVRRVRYRVRGWNAGQLDALRDASAALDDVLTRVAPDGVVVVGHSMGGRVAAHLAATGKVGAVAALAPWWPDDDAELVPPGCRLLTMHGTADTWTDPAAAHRQTTRASERGVPAHWVPVPGAGHFMLRRFHEWHRTTADFAMAQWTPR